MGKLLSIVLTDNHIRIAELSNGRRGVSVHRLLTKEVPESLVSGGLIVDVRGFADYLNTTLKYANIKTKKVVFSLPSDRIMSREVVLPEMKEEKLKTALKVNAPEYFPVELNDYVLSYFTISRILADEEETGEENGEEQRKKKAKKKKAGIGKRRSQLRLMVVAVPNDMVQSYYDAAKLAHLKLVSVDYIGNSVFQLTSNQIGDEPCLVIQLDEEHTVLTIYNETVMVLQRHVDFGSISLLQSIMDKMNCSQEEALEHLERRRLIHDNFDDGDELTDTLYYLVSNIKRVIEYYTGRNADHPLELVYIIGDGSRIDGLDGLFESQLNLPVERITALKQVSVKESAGLSMKEVLRYMDNIGAVLDPIDVIPKQLEQDIRRKLEAKAYRVMILLALFASVVIITIPATSFFNEAMETIDLQNKLLTVEDVKPILDNYREAQTRYSDVVQVQSLVRTNNESLSDFIAIFEQLRPSNISIQSFSCSEGQVSFSALAQGKKTVAKLIQQLNTIANVSEVKVSALSSVFEGDQETVAFSLTCVLINQDSLLNPGTKEEAVENLMPDEYSEIWMPEDGMEEDGVERDGSGGAGTDEEGDNERDVSLDGGPASADQEEDTQEPGQTEMMAKADSPKTKAAPAAGAQPAPAQRNTALQPAAQVNAEAAPLAEQTPVAPASGTAGGNPEAAVGETSGQGGSVTEPVPEQAPAVIPENDNAGIPAAEGTGMESTGPAAAEGIESGVTAS